VILEKIKKYCANVIIIIITRDYAVPMTGGMTILWHSNNRYTDKVLCSSDDKWNRSRLSRSDSRYNHKSSVIIREIVPGLLSVKWYGWSYLCEINELHYYLWKQIPTERSRNTATSKRRRDE